MPDQDDQIQPAEKPASPPADKPATPVEPTEEPATPAQGGESTQQAGRDQYGRQMYVVKCSVCGKDAQVPFKPSGNRPVYCRDCYMQQRQQRGGGPRR